MDMITFEEAYKIVMNSSFSTGTEVIPFEKSLNRILAEDVFSDTDMPPFNKSSVDGFACRRKELGRELEIIETIPAGKWPEKSPATGECSRIMTGAAVPEGADCVVMVEDTEVLPSGKMKFKGRFIKENIAAKGEDVKKGDIVLNTGIFIKPQDIAVMAAVGKTKTVVSKTPRIAVISSGDELVEPYEIPGISRIRNTNAYQLMAQMENTCAAGKYYGIAKDDEQETYMIIERAIRENDIVLVTGGVSMGDFDFIPGVLEKAGVRILFSRVAVQPGKPTTFGIHKKALVFGLPGNPVSSFVQFELLVRPLIYKMMGYDWRPVKNNYPIALKFTRKYDDRAALIPVMITKEGEALPVEFHGSGHLSSLTSAVGIIVLPIGVKSIEKGKIVSVRQI
jgi:molybdopterin molybdotransferase